jgi:alpha-amylase
MATSLFTQPAFLRTSNIYEVNVRQYTPEGTFKAFEQHLPRLKDMGVEILWMMPIHPIGIEKRKGILGSYYSIQNHKGINPEFGIEEDFRDLVIKVHSLDMKIIIDWVANHTSWDNVWTKTNPEFFVKDGEGNFVAPYDWNDVLQIDHTCEAEQIAMMDAMHYWINEFNIDGFRADLAHLTPLPFWLKARLHLSPLKKDLIWLAETEEINYHEAFDISYTWKWMHTTQQFVTGEKTLADCVKVLSDYKNNFEDNNLRLFFTSNHDENSWNGTEYEKYGIFAKAWAVFSLLYASVPLIYSGQELPNYNRLEFFEKDTIEWTADLKLHHFYTSLLALRKKNPVFTGLKAIDIYIDELLIARNLFSMIIKSEQEVVLCVINFNKVTTSENIFFDAIPGHYRDVFSGKEMILNNSFPFEGEAGGFCILEKYNNLI